MTTKKPIRKTRKKVSKDTAKKPVEKIKTPNEQLGEWATLAKKLTDDGMTSTDNSQTYICQFEHPTPEWLSLGAAYKKEDDKPNAEKQASDWQRREIATKFAEALLSNPKTANCRMNIIKRVVYYLLGMKREINIYPAMVAGAAIATTDELLKQLKTKNK